MRELDTSPEARQARHVADAWCAAFVLPKSPDAPELTQATLDAISAGNAAPAVLEAVERVGERYRWFHWHLEFPQLFSTGGTDAGAVTGWGGGFDCVIGNPPWERVKLQEQEWFASRLPAIAEAPNAAARKKMISALADDHPDLYAQFLADRRQAEGESHFLRNSGRYPLSGRGDINTYAVFAETDRALLAPTGRLGVILPTGIATDATTQHFFKDLVTTRTLISLFGFYDRGKLFEGADVHSFCLLSLSGRQDTHNEAGFAFYMKHPDDLRRKDTVFTLTPDEITLLNPNTGTCPVFRSRRDAEITLAIYRRRPVLIRHEDPDGNPWGLSFMTMFHMSNDSGLFHTREKLEREGWTLEGNLFRRGPETMLPLYEAKMIHHYDHRWATYDETGSIRDVTETEHADPYFVVQPRYWVVAAAVTERLAGRWNRDWLFGWRRVARSTDIRTIIAGSVPRCPTTDKIVLNFTTWNPSSLIACYSSIVLDYISRQKTAGTQVDYFIAMQLPVPPPEFFHDTCSWAPDTTLDRRITCRSLELTYTAWDIASFAEALGDGNGPFVWDLERRRILRAELDGAFFHLYGIRRPDVEHILSSFLVANRKDDNLARRTMLTYDSIAAAIESGKPFVSLLDPPPGRGLRHPRKP